MIKLSLQFCILDPGGHHRQGICLYHAMYRLNPYIYTEQVSARQLIGHYIIYPFVIRFCYYLQYRHFRGCNLDESVSNMLLSACNKGISLGLNPSKWLTS